MPVKYVAWQHIHSELASGGIKALLVQKKGDFQEMLPQAI